MAFYSTPLIQEAAHRGYDILVEPWEFLVCVITVKVRAYNYKGCQHMWDHMCKHKLTGNP